MALPFLFGRRSKTRPAERSRRKGFLKVKSAKDGVGVDGQAIEDSAENLDDNIAMLVSEHSEKSYRPLPVKQLKTPKPGRKEGAFA